MDNKLKLTNRIFITAFVLLIAIWFILAASKAYFAEGTQIITYPEHYFSCSEGWFDDYGNDLDITKVIFTEEDLGKQFEFHYQIPVDLELQDNYSICFYSRGMDIDAYMSATEDSPYNDPDEYGDQFFFEFRQESAGLSGNDIGLVAQIIPIYWSDIGNVVTFIITPTSGTAFIYDIRIQETSNFIYNALRSRLVEMFSSLVVMFFGIACFFYTLFSPSIEQHKKISYYALSGFSFIIGAILLIQTHVIQMLTSQPELPTAVTFFLLLISAYPLGVFIDSNSQIPHVRFSHTLGIITMALMIIEEILNYFFRITYFRMLPISILLLIFVFCMAVALLIKDILYCRNHRDVPSSAPVYIAVILLLLCSFADIIIFVKNQGRLTDYTKISRTAYVLFIVIMLGRALNLSINRDKMANLADKYKNEAITDALTGLYNKGAYLQKELELTHRLRNTRRKDDTPFSFGIMTLDLNNLKKVNDNQGHSSGDNYIQVAAQILKNAVSEHGKIYRVGGDEFTVLIFEDDIEKTYREIIDNLNRIVDEYNRQNPSQSPLSFAYGHAICSSNSGISITDAEKKADQEMYACKKAMKVER